jgi:hypothetical protein
MNFASQDSCAKKEGQSIAEEEGEVKKKQRI